MTEYYFVNVTYQGSCEGMDNFSIYQYSFSGAMEYITMAFIERMANDQIIPYCTEPQPHRIRAHVYTASCGIWVGCEYEIDENAQINCDRGYIPPRPDYGDPSNRKVKVYKWQSCGTTCCRRTFEFCRTSSIIGTGSIIKATLLSKEKLIECTGQSNMIRPARTVVKSIDQKEIQP